MAPMMLSAAEAAALIEDRASIVVSGNASICVPESVIAAIERRFLEAGRPRDISLVFPIVFGAGAGHGIHRFARKGFVRRVIGSSFQPWVVPNTLANLIIQNEIEAYSFPMGVLFLLMREIGAGRPGLITKVGLNCFWDPRLGGGRLNDKTREPLVEVVTLDGVEWLWYKAFPVHVAIIRGTTADEDGNISMEQEPQTGGVYVLALAARASGGKVIAQVKRLTKRGSIHPACVKVPGILVDAVVVDEHQEQSAEGYNPAFVGEVRTPVRRIQPGPLTLRKAVGRRAILEFKSGNVVNLGVGIAEVVPELVVEEGIDDLIVFSLEHGVIGGIPVLRMSAFGAHENPQAILDHTQIFDLYHGIGPDLACLSFAQVSREGHVNVGRFGDKISGAGGFPDIAHSARTIIICGTLTTSGLEAEVREGKLSIAREGRIRKFVNQVDEITLNANNARAKGQRVLYVTERAVFELGQEGLILTEIAPGVDPRRDILEQMECPAGISGNLVEMDKRIFRPEVMGLRASWSR